MPQLQIEEPFFIAVVHERTNIEWVNKIFTFKTIMKRGPEVFY